MLYKFATNIVQLLLHLDIRFKFDQRNHDSRFSSVLTKFPKFLYNIYDIYVTYKSSL